MIRFNPRTMGLLSTVCLVCFGNSGWAQAKTSAYDLLPDTTQAVVWVPNGEKLARHWEKTQFYALAHDPAVAPFFDEQRQELQKKLVDAGWRLNIKPEDLQNFSSGQIALAWLELADTPLKPYAMALLADVAVDNPAQNKSLLEKVDAELLARQAQKRQLRHEGIEIVKYTLPKRAGSLLAEDSYYTIVDGYFLATDDESLIKQLMTRIRGGSVEGRVLDEDPVFIEGREKLALSGASHVEYFVRPLGLARILRAIGGKRSKSNTDMLAVLRNQGFDAVQCVCGEVAFGLQSLDVSHRGYVLAERPLPKSAAVLDFPNQASHDVPSFVGKHVSSLLATHWNAEQAFWKTEGLVDEVVGTPGVFDEVIEGIKLDPNGPKIDIRQDVLPHFTNDIFSISDSKEGEPDVDSRRNLIALRLKNPEAMASVINRALRIEPDAEEVEFQGNTIWKVVHREDEEVLNLSDDFGDFGAPPPAAPNANTPQPWLSNWAITVYDDYLMFASHVEMIQDAIVQAKKSAVSPLLEEEDFQRVMAAVHNNFGEDDGCAWQVVRTSLAYRVQYELFREGKLRQSQSMLANILDRLLQNETEMRVTEQRVSGAKLPPFETISRFLQPSGVKVRSTDSGWEFGSLMLARDPNSADSPSQPQASIRGQGTARIGTHNTEEKR